MDNFLTKIKEQTTNVVAIDFDGVIHKNSKGFHDGTIYDEPLDGTEEGLKYLSKKYKVVIFTCKAKESRPLINGQTGKELIWKWLKDHNLDQYISDVTSEKPRAFKYIDDKAFQFISWKNLMENL